MSQLGEVLSGCREVLAAHAAVPLQDLTEKELMASVVAAEELLAATAGAQSRALYELHQRAIVAGNDYLLDELALILATSKRSVEVKMDLAVGLGTHALLREEVCQGHLPTQKANVILNSAADLVPEHASQVISRAVVIAPDNNAPQLRRKVNRLVHALDPAAADARHDRAVAESRVEFVPAPDGMAWINVFLPAQQATAAFHSIDALARQWREEDRQRRGEDSLVRDTEDPVPLDMWRAQAFTALTTTTVGGVAGCDAGHHTGHTACCDTGHDTRDNAGQDCGHNAGQDCGHNSGHHSGGRMGSGVEVHVTVAASTLLGLDDLPAELSRYGAISARQAREIAQDATWRRILTNDQGQTELVGSNTYKPGRILTRTVQHRDQTCTFPGCAVPALRCDLDHILAYDPDIPAVEQTVAANLHALCRYHHNAKTHGGWTPSSPDEYGTTAWMSPRGGVYRRSHPRNIDLLVAPPGYKSETAFEVNTDPQRGPATQKRPQRESQGDAQRTATEDDEAG